MKSDNKKVTESTYYVQVLKNSAGHIAMMLVAYLVFLLLLCTVSIGP